LAEVNADRVAQPAVLATPLLSLKAIYSRSLKSAKETSELLPASHSAVDLYSEDSGPGKSFKDVLSRSDIVGVIIALPIRNQPEFIEAALTAGKHVLAEKPVGPDVESAKKLISWYREIAAEKKVTWAVAEQFRFLPKYVWASEQARTLGKVIGFNFKVFQLCSQGAGTREPMRGEETNESQKTNISTLSGGRTQHILMGSSSTAASIPLQPFVVSSPKSLCLSYSAACAWMDRNTSNGPWAGIGLVSSPIRFELWT
jgi:hypothetical protein